MMIKKSLLAASLSLAFAAFSPAQAAVQTYNFMGTLDSGYFANMPFLGTLTFDDASLTGLGSEWVNVSALFTVLPVPALFTALDVDAGTIVEVGFQDGVFLGLSATFTSITPDPASTSQFTFTAGIQNISEAFLSYDTTLGFSGAGSVIYAAPVPEPETWATVLMGLGLVSLKFRARNKHFTLSHTGV